MLAMAQATAQTRSRRPGGSPHLFPRPRTGPVSIPTAPSKDRWEHSSKVLSPWCGDVGVPRIPTCTLDAPTMGEQQRWAMSPSQSLHPKCKLATTQWPPKAKGQVRKYL